MLRIPILLEAFVARAVLEKHQRLGSVPHAVSKSDPWGGTVNYPRAVKSTFGLEPSHLQDAIANGVVFALLATLSSFFLITLSVLTNGGCELSPDGAELLVVLTPPIRFSRRSNREFVSLGGVGDDGETCPEGNRKGEKIKSSSQGDGGRELTAGPSCTTSHTASHVRHLRTGGASLFSDLGRQN